MRGKERERAILMCVCVCSVDALLSRPECIEMKYENGVRKTDVDEGGGRLFLIIGGLVINKPTTFLQ